MGEGLWWLPSVIVFAVAAASVVVAVSAMRRRARRRSLSARSDADERQRQAAISLVRADDQVQAASDELGFAVAQFGEDAARELRVALEASRRDLRDAFALQHKLDDVTPDAAAVRLQWIEQITTLSARASDRLREQTEHFVARRGIERKAPAAVDRVRQALEDVTTREAGAEETLADVARAHAETALAGARSSLAVAQIARNEAQSAADAAASRLADGGGAPVGDELAAAERALYRAGRSLDQMDAAVAQLQDAARAVREANDAAVTKLAEARSLRDSHEEPEARSALNAAISDTEGELARLAEPGRRADPAADLVALREVVARLDRAQSDARNRQLRLENARAALGGALLTAESQIAVTRDFIGHNRARVGASARTRLAEAERQLGLARVEADPVTALDTARRAMTHATDADALARFDTH